MSMKQTKKICLPLLALLAISCSGKLQSGPECDGVMQELHFEVEPSSTKSSLVSGEMDGRISDLCIFVYADGVLLSSNSVFTTSTNPVVALPSPFREYRLFALANLGDCREEVHRDCPDVQAMERHVFDLGNYSSFSSKGLPMAVSASITPGSSASLKLKRQVCRIAVRLTNSSQYHVDVKSMCLKNSVRKIRPFGEPFAALSADDLTGMPYDDRLTAADISDAMDGGMTVYMYCCENMQGVLLPGNTEPKDKSINNIGTEKAGLVTYFEIASHVSSHNTDWENVYYRFCLGADATTDFNIERNTSYLYNVDFANTPQDTGWTVSPDVPQLAGEVPVSVSLASYYPGWHVLSFPEASVSNPVRINLMGSVYTIKGNDCMPRRTLDELQDNIVFTIGDKLIFQSSPTRDFDLHFEQQGFTPRDLKVKALPRTVLRMTAENARGRKVAVDYLVGSDNYDLTIDPYCPDRACIVPWADVSFPPAVVEHYGVETVNEYWAAEVACTLCLSDSPGQEYTANRLPLTRSDFCPEDSGESPIISFRAPSSGCFISSEICADSYGFYSDMWYDSMVFMPSSLQQRQMTKVVMDNDYGDISNTSRHRTRTLDMSGYSSYTAAFEGYASKITSSMPYGSIRQTMRQDNVMIVEFDAYASGRGAVDLFYWDYDKAPSDMFHIPLDVYMDVTVVPNFGLLLNAGRYSAGQTFAGAGVSSTAQGGSYATVVSGNHWGIQFIPARDDSRFVPSASPNSHEAQLTAIAGGVKICGQSGISTEYPRYSDLAWYNAGNIFNNSYTQVQTPPMDNGGTILFCSPDDSWLSTWTLRYSGAVVPSAAQYSSCAFRSLTDPASLTSYANRFLTSLRVSMSPLLYRNGVMASSFLRQEVGDGILVNYRISCERSLEMIKNDWDNY